MLSSRGCLGQGIRPGSTGPDRAISRGVGDGSADLRDSKHADVGPRLALSPKAWTDFVPYVPQG
ncbi:uncharacterized protein DUF397 [Streptomyces sp. Ag109_O5-1]|uniref:DUF397 domain-containing protein n=1 Tax=Streptomyces sp. Ag109_O5-1 TaxID=1938851 RepID=UPI000F508A1E|nr:DUF397 domain-containing protein [Streptomyces sp. Ag109_O5-1]RPE40956.1 uncharacterized protein DUF397 [Streptomyces sp. Ag109_O5-1]